MSIDLSKYHKNQGDSLTAEQWNELLETISFGINSNKFISDVKVDGKSCVNNGVADIIGISDLKDKVDDSKFYVNDVLVKPINGIIKLESNKTDSALTYKLRGRLNGSIEVGNSEDTPTLDTTIILDGVDITTSNTYGIVYKPSVTGSKDLNIIVSRDSINQIVLVSDAEIADNQEACIMSNNNMRIAGCGYLTLVNRGGHGIKASELLLSGKNHIYIEASHDGIHGGSLLNIDEGVFFINKANDAFGSGPSGAINVFGGKFYAYNIKQNVFDSKMPGYYLNDLDISTDVDNALLFSGMSKYSNSVEGTAVVSYELEDGTGDVYNGCVLSDNTYTISNPTESFTTDNPLDKVILTLTGNFVDKSFVFNTDVKKVDVILNGTSITNETLNCIKYQAEKSRIKIKASKDTINIITSNGTEAAITSSKNSQIEVKSNSHLIINTKTSKGLTCSEFFITDSSGSLIFNTSDAGIEGSELYIGGDPDVEKDGTPTRDKDNTYFSGSIIAPKLKARMSSQNKKGTFQIFDKYCTGSVYVNSIDAPSTIDLEKSDHIFYKLEEDSDNPEELTHSVVHNIPKVEETFEYIPYRKIPVISK